MKMISLYPFVDPPRCRKCGSYEIQTQYRFIASQDADAVTTDCLNRTCANCGFEWHELTYDSLFKASLEIAEESVVDTETGLPIATAGIPLEAAEGKTAKTRSKATDGTWAEIRDRVSGLLADIAPFEGTAREVADALLGLDPEMPWLRNRKNVGPFSIALRRYIDSFADFGVRVALVDDEGVTKFSIERVGDEDESSGTAPDEEAP